MDFVEKVQDLFASRKVAITLSVFLFITLLAIAGAILEHFLGTPDTLIREAMYLITGSGGTGVAAQAIPDALQAKRGDYRSGNAAQITAVQEQVQQVHQKVDAIAQKVETPPPPPPAPVPAPVEPMMPEVAPPPSSGNLLDLL